MMDSEGGTGYLFNCLKNVICQVVTSYNLKQELLSS